MIQCLFLQTVGCVPPTPVLLQLKPLFFSVCGALGRDVKRRENSWHPIAGFQKSKSLEEKTGLEAETNDLGEILVAKALPIVFPSPTQER